MLSDTSAKLRAGRVAAPAKITSSIPPPRIAEARFTPMTHRNASRRLDLPQPLGPTTPVRPSDITNSVGSTKLLKPFKRNLENRTGRPFGDSYPVLLSRRCHRRVNHEPHDVDKFNQFSTRYSQI